MKEEPVPFDKFARIGIYDDFALAHGAFYGKRPDGHFPS